MYTLSLLFFSCQDTEPAVSAVDSDNDGFTAAQDCDDSDPLVHPGAAELCDGIDNNCDGSVDDLPLITSYADQDGDGYGDPSAVSEACAVPAGFCEQAEDCDDRDPSVHPGAAELCDDIDNDCDSSVDEGVVLSYSRDSDGDGYGADVDTGTGCSVPSGYAVAGGDCDDTDADRHPGAAEVACDGIDNNCIADSGGAVWIGDDGTEEDLSAMLSEGLPTAPVAIALTEPGSLRFCEGQHAVSLTVEADVTVEGWGTTQTELTSEVGRVLTARGSTASLSDLAITGTDGGVWCEGQGTLRITDAQITAETTGNGGGISATDGCTVSLSSATISGSSAVLGGALYLEDSTATAEDTTFSRNEADTGGALYLDNSTITLISSILSGNSAFNAGAVELVSSTVSAVDTTFRDNIGAWAAYTSAGGLRLQSSSHATLTDCTVQDNVASWGGGMWSDASSSIEGIRVDFITNHPDDVEKAEVSYDLHKGAVFTCSAGSDRCE
ncbi:MAG: MopE-related protein [Myxococcota bacterium]|nr:MopE-related protein [Myxococcota bacterium]